MIHEFAIKETNKKETKNMKKLSLLVAIALLITVGGVYATWYYAVDDPSPEHKQFLVNMDTVKTDISKGDLELNTSGFRLLIDDGGEYTPKLKDEGSITITFKPDASAEPNIKAEGILLQFKIEMSKDEAHLDNPASIVYFNDVDEDGLNPVSRPVFTKYENTVYVPVAAPTGPNGDGSFTYTIPSSAIADLIELNSDIKLETYDEFLSYQLLIGSYGYGITVSEVLVP